MASATTLANQTFMKVAATTVGEYSVSSGDRPDGNAASPTSPASIAASVWQFTSAPRPATCHPRTSSNSKAWAG
ncbi:hypothetical protein [uncultured Celeribacter sp.]|uniref:hypothetical protein n=1 Tax=uncultured Celeribacter sp. TaxID=1303376 RepID=UPI002AA766DD|nr:hypothetical protein [uncultured Celeribacter sp.]